MKINSSNKKATISTTSMAISEQKVNQPRVRLTIVNTSTASEVVSIAIDDEAVLYAGYTLYAGGNVNLEAVNGIPLNQGRVTAIASAGTATISIYEEVLSDEF